MQQAQPIPLVLIPGLLLTADMWAGQIPFLGQFADPRPTDHHRHFDTIDAIAEGILAETPERFAVCGLSMGGYVALELVRRAPARITRLALLDTSAIPETPEQTANREKLIRLGREQGMDAVVDDLFPALVRHDPATDQRLLESQQEMARAVGQDEFERQQRAIQGRRDQRPELPRIRCPTLILCGAEDMITPPALSMEMHRAIGHSELVMLPDCGHLSAMERPQEVNQALSRWLTRTPAGTS